MSKWCEKFIILTKTLYLGIDLAMQKHVESGLREIRLY